MSSLRRLSCALGLLVLLALVGAPSAGAAKPTRSGTSASPLAPRKSRPTPQSKKPRKTSKAAKAARSPKVAPAPEPMKQAKFVETVNTMVDKSQWGEINSLPQKLDFHLTPMHPIDKGAKIEGAYGIGFVPPYAGASDGLYWLSGQQWYYRASEVALSVPTDKGELYVVDCRILESDYYGVTRQGTMGVWVPGIVDDEITAKDGHLVFAFKATKHRTWIELGYEDKEGDEWLFLAFWGCDIGKAS